jgi:hypothetical protein
MNSTYNLDCLSEYPYCGIVSGRCREFACNAHGRSYVVVQSTSAISGVHSRASRPSSGVRFALLTCMLVSSLSPCHSFELPYSWTMLHSSTMGLSNVYASVQGICSRRTRHAAAILPVQGIRMRRTMYLHELKDRSVLFVDTDSNSSHSSSASSESSASSASSASSVSTASSASTASTASTASAPQVVPHVIDRVCIPTAFSLCTPLGTDPSSGAHHRSVTGTAAIETHGSTTVKVLLPAVDPLLHAPINAEPVDAPDSSHVLQKPLRSIRMQSSSELRNFGIGVHTSSVRIGTYSTSYTPCPCMIASFSPFDVGVHTTLRDACERIHTLHLFGDYYVALTLHSDSGDRLVLPSVGLVSVVLCVCFLTVCSLIRFTLYTCRRFVLVCIRKWRTTQAADTSMDADVSRMCSPPPPPSTYWSMKRDQKQNTDSERVVCDAVFCADGTLPKTTLIPSASRMPVSKSRATQRKLNTRTRPFQISSGLTAKTSFAPSVPNLHAGTTLHKPDESDRSHPRTPPDTPDTHNDHPSFGE